MVWAYVGECRAYEEAVRLLAYGPELWGLIRRVAFGFVLVLWVDEK
jgi:hypothetical protein